MPQKLLQHKHCITCGKAVLVTEEYCSEECERSHSELLRKKRKQLLFLWMGAVAVLILAVVLSFG
jgi:predicted nucleic acid-binding Zn ribbon protein